MTFGFPIRKAVAVGVVLELFCSPIVHAKTQSLLTQQELTFSTSESKRPFIPATENYPDGAFLKVQKEELDEIKRLERAKETASQVEQEYEQHKRDVEREIQIKRKKIEDAKVAQDKMKKDREFFETDLVQVEANKTAVDKDYAAVTEKANKFTAEYNAIKGEYEKKKYELEQQERNLKTAGKDSELKINSMQVEMERMRREIAGAESDTSKSLNMKARIDAEVARVNNEHETVSSNWDIARQKRNDAKEDLLQANRILANQQKEISDRKRELVALETETSQLNSQAAKSRAKNLAEAKKLEYQIAENNSARLSMESEKAKYETENERLQTALAAARTRKEASELEMQQDRAIVLESRIKSEKTKTEISRLRSEENKARLDNDTLKVKMRNIASMADQSGMNGAEISRWMMKKSCFLHTEALEESKKMGVIEKGKQLAGQLEGQYIKVLNSSGRTMFVNKNCASEMEE